MSYGRTRDEALTELRKHLKPGDVVYTTVTHTSSSGMMRVIRPFIVRKGEPWDISYLVGPALGLRQHDRYYGLKVSGCGMDMGFWLVYELSHSLFPSGFNCAEHKRGPLVTPAEGTGIKPYRAISQETKSRKHCPANDHVNYRPSIAPVPYHHRDGGYALNHRWL